MINNGFKSILRKAVPFLVFVAFAYQVDGQQLADPDFKPTITTPQYDQGKGPLVYIDAGHHNFHTMEGRYAPFAELLQRDGYRTESYEGLFQRDRLQKADILVISNALHEASVNQWHLPTPSAFTIREMDILENWIREGGSLFLIADHMPMGGAAEDLAARFGFGFTNGFAIDTVNQVPQLFTTGNGNLVESTITSGRTSAENVNSVATFTGQAFDIPAEATPILILDNRFVNLLPDTAWVFHRNTPTQEANGMHQGAYREFGKGKVVVFGEAAMFTAQLAGSARRKMGMNHPEANQNYQLLLNIIHWLDD